MKKILFITGSMNQTTQMYSVAEYLRNEYDCYFSQFYGSHPVIRFIRWTGVLDQTIMAGGFQQKSEQFMEGHGYKNDFRMEKYNNHYDMVVLCNDMVMPHAFRRTKTVFVQEGMTDIMTSWGKVVYKLKLPRFVAMNTALNGASNLCDIYCAASEGYKEHFAKLGTDKDKIIVTGIPNYDNAASFLNNNFPHKGYVMVATSDIREIFSTEDRVGHIKEWVKIANGRQMLFKLHPNEITERAFKEIRENAPEGTLIYQEGSTNEMIANCDELITQWSTVVYLGMALGKKVHSYFDMEELKRLQPIQNGGTSAATIAELCRNYIDYKGSGREFLKGYKI